MPEIQQHRCSRHLPQLLTPVAPFTAPLLPQSRSKTYSWKTLRALARDNLAVFATTVQKGGDLEVRCPLCLCQLSALCSKTCDKQVASRCALMKCINWRAVWPHLRPPFGHPTHPQVAARLLYPDEVPKAPEPPTTSAAVPKPTTLTAGQWASGACFLDSTAM